MPDIAEHLEKAAKNSEQRQILYFNPATGTYEVVEKGQRPPDPDSLPMTTLAEKGMFTQLLGLVCP